MLQFMGTIVFIVQLRLQSSEECPTQFIVIPEHEHDSEMIDIDDIIGHIKNIVS